MWRSVILNFVHVRVCCRSIGRLSDELRLCGVRFSSQFMRRRPIKMFTADEFADEEYRAGTDEPDIIDLSHEFPANDTPKREFEKTKPEKMAKKRTLAKTTKLLPKSVLRQETDPDLNENLDDLDTNTNAVFDDNGNLRFIKVGTNNTKICLLMTQLKMRNYREKRGIMLLEGKRLIREALLAGMEMKYLIFSRIEDLDFFKDAMPSSGCTVFKMFYRDIQIWSDLVTSPGLIAVFKTPNLAEKAIDKSAIPVSVICDSIREPGNLGSILRICTAGSCKRIFLLKGCADLWNIKVSRGASGVHFHSRISNNYEWDRIAKRIPENAKILIADTINNNNNNNNEPDSNLDQHRPQLPLVNYDEIELLNGANGGGAGGANEEVFLIIGGETEGISREAYELAAKRNGCRVHIPLAKHVNSLNSSTAFGIILFELRKLFKRTSNA